MDEYITTYNKDYLWPPLRPNNKEPVTNVSASKLHPCTCNNAKLNGDKESANLPTNNSYEWSRLGPMGLLLDPKLYPVKNDAGSEIKVMKINQPNVYPKKPHGNCHSILQTPPQQYMSKYINLDRPRTTYETDYSHANELSSINNVNGGSPEQCPTPIQVPNTECCPQARLRASFRANSTSKEKTQNRQKNENDGDLKIANQPWKSEYQDVVSRTGDAIIKHKLHRQHGISSKGKSFVSKNLKPCP